MFHEYVLTLAFGFFYPVLCTMFGAIGCKYRFFYFMVLTFANISYSLIHVLEAH